jgi:hypothetical protein
MKIDKKQKKFLKTFTPLAAFFGGLCCFTPVVLVFFGIGTVSYAASLSDVLYGQYKWVFRGSALLFILLALGWYFYKKENICSIDEVKRKRKRIINFTLIVLISTALLYIFWLYVVVELIGLSLGIWSL